MALSLVRALLAMASLSAGASCGGGVSADGDGQGGASPIDASPGDASGDAQASCADGMKRCGAACVARDDPAFGCAPGSCAPCAAPNSTPHCAGGACAFTCVAGYADCNAQAGDGCEANLASDPDHCGACGNACPFSASCAEGTCVACACIAGWANCDGDCANGCETDLQVDPKNCGACGNLCGSPGNSANCVAGVCVSCACPPGLTDCDGDCSNGCETNLGVDPKNCGLCGSQCAPGMSCMYGVCMP